MTFGNYIVWCVQTSAV